MRGCTQNTRLLRSIFIEKPVTIFIVQTCTYKNFCCFCFDFSSDWHSLCVNHNNNQNNVTYFEQIEHCSAHVNKHHTPSMLEVGCRQLRRIDWAERPICLFLFAFRPLGSSGQKNRPRGRLREAQLPLHFACAKCDCAGRTISSRRLPLAILNLLIFNNF